MFAGAPCAAVHTVVQTAARIQQQAVACQRKICNHFDENLRNMRKLCPNCETRGPTPTHPRQIWVGRIRIRPTPTTCTEILPASCWRTLPHRRAIQRRDLSPGILVKVTKFYFKESKWFQRLNCARFTKINWGSHWLTLLMTHFRLIDIYEINNAF